MTARVRWPYAAAMPLIWLGHIGLTYLAVALHCHQELLEGDLIGMAGIRALQLLITLGASAAIGFCVVRIRARVGGSEDEAERNFALGATLLGAAFLVYMVWTLGPELTVQPCHR